MINTVAKMHFNVNLDRGVVYDTRAKRLGADERECYMEMETEGDRQGNDQVEQIK